MKPIKAGDSSADAGAQVSFSDSLENIDVSSLDRLIGIRQEQQKLTEYRAKAEEKKKDVAEAVYARVTQDYARRAAALDAQSAPLRAQARAEYRKLKALLDALGARQDQAQLEKDELQFRHEVGELGDGELAARLVEPQHVLDQCARDRKELDASKARFVEAIGSEDALEASDPVPAGAPAPTAAVSAAVAAASAVAAAPAPAAAQASAAAPAAAQASAAASAQPAGAAAPNAASAAKPPPPATPAARAPAPEPRAPAIASARATPPAPAAKPADEDPGETRVARPVADLDQPTRVAAGGAAPASRPAAPASASAPKAAVDDDGADGATVMLATAAIVVDGSGGKEYPLSVLNGIGRSEENRICLSSPGISRKHAMISAASGGFVIKDLGSQNGTFVNGQRITEKKLAEGDTIEVGSVKFVFRSPWPPRGEAAAAREAATQGKR